MWAWSWLISLCKKGQKSFTNMFPKERGLPNKRGFPTRRGFPAPSVLLDLLAQSLLGLEVCPASLPRLPHRFLPLLLGKTLLVLSMPRAKDVPLIGEKFCNHYHHNCMGGYLLVSGSSPDRVFRSREDEIGF